MTDTTTPPPDRPAPRRPGYTPDGCIPELNWYGVPMRIVVVTDMDDAERVFSGFICADPNQPERLTAFYSWFQGAYRITPEPGCPGLSTSRRTVRACVDLARQWIISDACDATTERTPDDDGTIYRYADGSHFTIPDNVTTAEIMAAIRTHWKGTRLV